MRSSSARPCGSRNGQGLVEFGLILPILILVFSGMVEAGWWVNTWITVATAAREGGRFGSRGLHVPASTIAEVTAVALGNTIDIDLVGGDANTRIIVTEIDIEPDGSYAVFDTFTSGDLLVGSAVCFGPSCAAGTIDLGGVMGSNVVFNNEPELCQDALGCRDDIVVVEVFFRHTPFMPLGSINEYIGDALIINARSVMRVMFRRTPF